MAEFLPPCTYDGIGVGYDVGIYDKGMLFDSIIFSTADAIIADGNLAKAESFGITDGVHYIILLVEALSTADSITKAGEKGIAESLSLTDIIATGGELTRAEAFSIEEFIPVCTYDGVGVGYDVGTYDESWIGEAKIGDLGKAETFSIADSLMKAGAEAIAESLSLADSIVTDGELTKAESFGITDGIHYLIALAEALLMADSLTKAGAEAIAESLSLADSIVTDGELTKAEAFSIVDSIAKSGDLAKAEILSITDDEAFQKYMYMKIRKINITFSAGNYESVIELED